MRESRRRVGRQPSGGRRALGAGRAARHVAVGAAAAVLLSLGPAPLAGIADRAGAEDAAFAAGSGRASAKVLRVGPLRGSLALAPTLGVSLSDFLNTRGRGDVRTADFAALEDSLPPELVGLFPTVKVESTDEDSEAGRTTSLGVPGGPAAAELHADAGPAPYGRSVFRAAPIDLAAVAIDGGVAESFSGVRDGRVREATGVVRIGKLDIGGGALVLEGLEWRALHRTGEEQAEAAQFRVGAVRVAGQRFAAPDGAEQPLADAIAAAEPLLGPLGIQVQLPQARIAGGIVEMSPLRVRLADSELGPVLSPILEAVQPAREALIDAVRSASEDTDAAILLADVAIGVIAGGSQLDLEIGGVVAQTAEPAAGFSFGMGSGGFDLAPVPTASAPAVGATPASSGLPGSNAGDVAAGAGASSPSPGTDAAEGRALTPAGGSATSSGGAGALLPLGLAAVAAAVLSGVADYYRVRRQPLPVASAGAY